MTAILCVDDDKRPLDRITNAVKNVYPNLEVITARSGEDALQIIRQMEEPFKVVITDFELSLDKRMLNGSDLAKEIRRIKIYADVPVYLLSGTKREDWEELGFDGSYDKRDCDELKDVVKKIGMWI